MRGHTKGSNYERKCAKRLSLWVSNKARRDCFWRSAMSGGRFTQLKKRGESLDACAGDITCTHELGQDFASMFVCEIKHYRSLKLGSFLYESSPGAQGPDIRRWWKKLIGECSGTNRCPFLIMRENFQWEWVLLNSEGLRICRYAGLGLKVWWHIPNLDMWAVKFIDILMLPHEKFREMARLRKVGQLPRPILQ